MFFDFNPPSDDANLEEKIRYVVKINYLRFSVICLAMAAASSVAYACLVAPNLVESSNCLLNAMSVTLIVFKASLCLFRREDIWMIFTELREIFITRKSENSLQRVKKYLDDYLRFVNIYFALIFFDYLATLPLTLSFIIYVSMTIVINYWFPFDSTKNYPLVLLFADYITYLCLAHMFVLLYSLITSVAMEFDLLRDDLKNVKLFPAPARNKRFKRLFVKKNIRN